MFKQMIEQLVKDEFTASAMTEDDFLAYAKEVLGWNFSKGYIREARFKHNIPINRRGTIPHPEWKRKEVTEYLLSNK